VISPLHGRVLIEPNEDVLLAVRNRREFIGMLVLDKWACNRDSRQVVFWRRCRERKYSACFIDHGYCFGANEWELHDRWVQGMICRKEAYSVVTGWDSFEPWLSQLEGLSPDLIWRAMEDTPPSWYRSDWTSLEQLGEKLIIRRGLVRDLIEEFRTSPRNPFPKWNQNHAETS